MADHRQRLPFRSAISVLDQAADRNCRDPPRPGPRALFPDCPLTPSAVECRIDRRSGVPAFQQIVRQTKQVLRLGVLVPGDRLPTAKDGAETSAVNPNTAAGLKQEDVAALAASALEKQYATGTTAVTGGMATRSTGE